MNNIKNFEKSNLILSNRLLESIQNIKSFPVRINEKTLITKPMINNIIIKKILSKDSILNIAPPKIGNYFDLIEKTITYNPIPKNQEINKDNKWTKSGRELLKKPYKLFSHIFKNNMILSETDSLNPLNNSSIKKYEQRGIEILSETYKFIEQKINVSSEVSRIYGIPTSNIESIGTLNTSCMRIESDYNCRQERDFYDTLGIKIIYILDTYKHLVARALLWENVFVPELGKYITLVDRIYGSELSINNIIQWADQKGYYTKYTQSASETTIIINNHKVNSTLTYSIDNWIKRGGYPYMDTFYTLNNNLLYSNPPRDIDSEYDLQNTEEDVASCYQCGCSLEGSEEITIGEESYCDECAVYSYYNDAYIVREDSVYSKFHDSYLWEDDTRYISHDNDYILSHLNNITTECSYCDEEMITSYGTNKHGHFCSDHCLEVVLEESLEESLEEGE